MAVGLLLEFKGLGKAEYERVMQELKLDSEPPDGGIFHIAGPIPGGWRVVDVWETAGHFEAFQRDRLSDALSKAGVTDPPVVADIFPLHNLYAPGIAVLGRLGASSMPR